MREPSMAESFTSQITVDKTIVSLLSKFTYERSFPYALRELVSNAYDADATEARVVIDLAKDRVVILDNGTGMTREEFDFYLRIAGQKRGKRETPKFGRKRIGQFGVGFLAILPFCESLQITSTTENSEERFTADIPAWKFFRQDGKTIDVGEIEVTGELTRNAKFKPEHFTEINLLKLSEVAKRYFKQKAPAEQNERAERVVSWPPIDRLRWEMQEDLPLAFPENSKLTSILAYPEPIGMDVYFQGRKLQRNCVKGEVIESGDLDVEGIKLRYVIMTPWTAVKPYELRGLKMRLNNVGVGPRQIFAIEIGRRYSRLQWLSGEVQILSGLDSAVTLSRDAFISTPEYEAVTQKLGSILRKWADYVETVDVAARDMTKQLRGGKQVVVASKKDVVDRNIRALEGRGFEVRRVDERGKRGTPPVHVDRTKKQVTVYQEHPDLEDTISIAGKKRRIIYTNSSTSKRSFETACRVNGNGDVEIDTQYPLFRSKRYGDVFKRVYIIAALAKSECSSPGEMLKFILSQIDREFKDF
jgi:Histidine kinase-, DNA gyrase B-, and HSP90-like ATPase